MILSRVGLGCSLNDLGRSSEVDQVIIIIYYIYYIYLVGIEISTYRSCQYKLTISVGSKLRVKIEIMVVFF